MENNEFIDEERINNFINIICLSIESIAIYKAMSTLLEKYKNDNVFVTLFNHNAMMIVIRISDLFGKNNEDNHWKKLFKKCHYEDFRNKVIFDIFEDQGKFNDFYENLTSFRSNYVVHYSVGEKKFYQDKNRKLTYLPDLDIVVELLKKTLIYVLNYFKIFGSEDAISDVTDLYNEHYIKTLMVFK